MTIPVASLFVLASGAVLWSCGDPGYSFGRYDEQVAEVAPLVDRYCERARECAPRALGMNFNECRVVLLSDVLSVGGECAQPLEALTECAEWSPCLEFPILSGRASGGCGAQREAFHACMYQPASTKRGQR